jgi:VWFA-related protein
MLCAGLILLSCGGYGAAQQPAAPAPGNIAQPQALEQGWDPGAGPEDGLIHLDVTATDASGKPVAGLTKSDFTLFDQGSPAAIQSFQAFDNIRAKPDPPAELILILDHGNLNPINAAGADRALLSFLRQNGGHLALPTRVYRYSDSGLEVTSKPSSDGNSLADAIEKKHGMSWVWQPALHYCSDCNGAMYYERDPVLDSTRALWSVVLAARRRPGRKIVIWIGYGWPVKDHTNAFDTITEFSTRLREARVTHYGVSAWADPKVLDDHRPYDYKAYLNGVRSAKDAKFAHLSLDVLAAQSGGTTV